MCNLCVCGGEKIVKPQFSRRDWTPELYTNFILSGSQQQIHEMKLRVALCKVKDSKNPGAKCNSQPDLNSVRLFT
jgi:hypothetical protein